MLQYYAVQIRSLVLLVQAYMITYNFRNELGFDPIFRCGLNWIASWPTIVNYYGSRNVLPFYNTGPNFNIWFTALSVILAKKP